MHRWLFYWFLSAIPTVGLSAELRTASVFRAGLVAAITPRTHLQRLHLYSMRTMQFNRLARRTPWIYGVNLKAIIRRG